MILIILLRKTGHVLFVTLHGSYSVPSLKFEMYHPLNYFSSYLTFVTDSTDSVCVTNLCQVLVRTHKNAYFTF